MEHGGKMKLLYDGQCPFCRSEVAWLRRADRHHRIEFVAVSGPSFHPVDYGLTRDAVEGALHAVVPGGRTVRAMDAVRAAYRAIGLGWLVAPTAWPGLRALFDAAYRLFARNRVHWGNALLRLTRRR